MLSVSMLSTGARAVASMMSPEKNPCRVKDSTKNWYRYDPYMSRVMPSPLKTQLISPIKNSSNNCGGNSPASAAPAPCDEINEVTGLHRNSLFNTPAAMSAAPIPTVQQQQQAMMPSNNQYRQDSNHSQQQYHYTQSQEYYTPVPQQQQQPTRTRTVEAPAPVASTNSAPTASSSESGKTHYAVIYFKHDSATFIAPFRIANGDHVIVEGDRGVDIGVVGDITTTTPAYPVPLKIVRRATAKDMEAFNQKTHKEQVVRAQVQEQVDELSLGVQIVDTEFQFDNNKLTVFFDGKKQIDFRKLQRNLFREHRCRIWLSNMAEIEYNAKLQRVRRTR